MSLLSWLLVILAGLSLAAMVVSLTIASRSAREARSTIFPIVREEETVRARRARIATSVTGVIAAIMAGAFFLSGQLPSPSVVFQQAPAEAIAVVESPVAETEVPLAPTETPLLPTDEQMAPVSRVMGKCAPMVMAILAGRYTAVMAEPPFPLCIRTARRMP